MKRFYKHAVPARGDTGFHIVLDGRPAHTPGGGLLALPTSALALAVAGEWEAQRDNIDPRSMPLTQMAATVIDLLPAQRPAMTARLLNYVDTDLLCLRAESPPELRAHQDAEWQPPLDWLHAFCGARLNTARGVSAPAQPAESRHALEKKIESLANWPFMGLHEAASSSGSLVLALGLCEQVFGAARVFVLSELESLFQAQVWGLDHEMERRHKAIRADLQAVENWFRLLKAE